MSHTHRAPSRVLSRSPRRLELRLRGPQVQLDRKATRTALAAFSRSPLASARQYQEVTA